MKTQPILLKHLSLAALALVFATSALAQDAPAGNANAAKKKVALCIGCHGIIGYQASFPEVHKVPMISGQNAKYIASALTAYRKGDRKHPTMKGVAAPLSDQDIADLAAYYEASGSAIAPTPAKGGEASPEVQALLTRATPSGPARTPTTSMWRSSPTRLRATRSSVATTPSWARRPSSLRMPNSSCWPTTWAACKATSKRCRSPSSAEQSLRKAENKRRFIRDEAPQGSENAWRQAAHHAHHGQTITALARLQ